MTTKILIIISELKYIFLRRKYAALVDITDKCNLRCRHCYHKDSVSAEDRTTIKEWAERFGRYRRMGIMHVAFAGGEPSLRYDILQLAERYFPLIETFTNGQLKISENFKHRIILSLEGCEEEHDGVCGRGAFRGAVNNYSGDKRVIVYTVLSKMNYRGRQKLMDFLEIIRKMNVFGVRFSLFIPKIGEDDSVLLTDDQRMEVGGILLEELKRKDSVLLMTKGMINFLINGSSTTDHCALKRMYFFDSRNAQKKCVNNEIDCSRCSCIAKYAPSPRKIMEWLAFKSLGYKNLSLY